MIVNEATGEVTAEIGGKTFRLHATMRRVAELQAELGAKNFQGIHEGLGGNDIGAILAGLRCLCVSGNEGEIDDLPFGPTMAVAVDAIYKALAAGLPDEKSASRGNGSATTMKKTPRRGRAIENSLTA